MVCYLQRAYDRQRHMSTSDNYLRKKLLDSELRIGVGGISDSGHIDT